MVAQGLAAAGLAWPGRARWELPRPVALLAMLGAAVGGALSAEGLRFLGRDLTPMVAPRTEARLRTTGPYAVSRNPVYAGLLAVAVAVAVLRRRPEPLAAAVALSAVLHVKVDVEELRLRDRFGVEYAEYAARTPRLLGLPKRP